ncbi:glycosyltransferase family 9 protein [Candidatus Omnitrophota bacterium]
MIASKKSLKEAKNILFVVTGGLGRNIMSTAVVRNLKKAYPDKKLIVACGMPDVFLKNPNVYRTYNLSQPVFLYEDFIRNNKTIVIQVEPYQNYDYVYRKRHFVQVWCEMIGIGCDNIYPEIFFTDTEKKMAELYLHKFDKEMVLLQGEGGKPPPNNSEKERIVARSLMYKRSLPTETMQKITDKIIEKGYMVGSVGTENQFYPSMAEKINFSARAIIALIPYVAGVISIDSFLQHGCAIFKKKATVLWGGTDPKVLGYEFHDNLVREVCPTPKCHRPNSYLWDFETTGHPWDCPYDDKCMNFSTEKVMKSFNSLTGGKDGRKKEERVDKQREADGCSKGHNPYGQPVRCKDKGLKDGKGGTPPEVSAG